MKIFLSLAEPIYTKDEENFSKVGHGLVMMCSYYEKKFPFINRFWPCISLVLCLKIQELVRKC